MENTYRFSQAAHIAGKDYARGVHQVPEKVEYDPYFIKLVGAGLIQEVDAPPAATQETPAQRSERLHNRLVAKADALKAGKTKTPVPPVKAETTEATESAPKADTDGDDKPKEKKAHSDKHKK